jgi:acylphosphatase
MMQKRLTIRVSGKVQGVWFRARTREEVEKLSLTGSVWNNPDGSVGIVAEGEAELLQKLLSWCRRGPSMARVTDLSFDWQEYRGEFDGFKIDYV